MNENLWIVWASDRDNEDYAQAVRGPFATAEEAMADLNRRPILDHGLIWDVCTIADARLDGIDLDAL